MLILCSRTGTLNIRNETLQNILRIREKRRNDHESRFLLLGIVKHVSQSERVSLAKRG